MLGGQDWMYFLLPHRNVLDNTSTWATNSEPGEPTELLYATNRSRTQQSVAVGSRSNLYCICLWFYTHQMMTSSKMKLRWYTQQPSQTVCNSNPFNLQFLLPEPWLEPSGIISSAFCCWGKTIRSRKGSSTYQHDCFYEWHWHHPTFDLMHWCAARTSGDCLSLACCINLLWAHWRTCLKALCCCSFWPAGKRELIKRRLWFTCWSHQVTLMTVVSMMSPALTVVRHPRLVGMLRYLQLDKPRCPQSSALPMRTKEARQHHTQSPEHIV